MVNQAQLQPQNQENDGPFMAHANYFISSGIDDPWPATLGIWEGEVTFAQCMSEFRSGHEASTNCEDAPPRPPYSHKLLVNNTEVPASQFTYDKTEFFELVPGDLTPTTVAKAKISGDSNIVVELVYSDANRKPEVILSLSYTRTAGLQTSRAGANEDTASEVLISDSELRQVQLNKASAIDGLGFICQSTLGACAVAAVWGGRFLPALVYVGLSAVALIARHYLAVRALSRIKE